MSTLQDFLNDNLVNGLTDEVAISPRFKDSAGNLLKFKIKALSNTEFESIRKRCMTIGKKGKVDFNTQQFNSSLVIEHTIEPNFKDAASLAKVGAINPEDYLNKVLLSGEITTLAEEIQKLSGFNVDMDSLVEEAKN
ncbi:hypothetical protein J2Z32_003468 [Paenibacillus turicensis]|uniref:XkdN-like protein n=1 Tax=Paenibacillus turicensis TaxID=160487 RepID=A0ABS4FWA5_9BACL|nr:XkdN-like protein [Paenibacillus turicensis]MBP1906804.1 hypothetical protein [Paenibacillus turicensis]